MGIPFLIFLCLKKIFTKQGIKYSQYAFSSFYSCYDMLTLDQRGEIGVKWINLLKKKKKVRPAGLPNFSLGRATQQFFILGLS